MENFHSLKYYLENHTNIAFDFQMKFVLFVLGHNGIKCSKNYCSPSEDAKVDEER